MREGCDGERCRAREGLRVSAVREIGLMIGVQPLTLTRDDALRFTGLSPSMFETLERRRAITPRRLGNRGERLYYRAQLEQVTASLFTSATDDEADDFA